MGGGVGVAGRAPLDGGHIAARVKVGPARNGACPGGAPLRERAADVERGAVAEALSRYGGKRTRAARSLGLSRQGLTKKMRRLGLST